MLDLSDAVNRLDSAPVAFAIERDLLIVTGPDSATYLQGQLSQDVEGLAAGATARSLLLQPQGKVDAWLRVHRLADDTFWLDTDRGHGDAAVERLNRFKLRVAVEIELQPVTAVAVRGPGAGEVVAGQASAGELDGLVPLDASWGGVAGIDLVSTGTSVVPDAVADALGIALGPPALAEVVRIGQGLPAMGHELDPSTIPAAAGIVEPSVDFTKGCYVGQELVARVDSRGNNTPTRLHALRFGGTEAPPAGAALVLGDDEVGTVTSAVEHPAGAAVGLGYLKRSVTAPVALAARTEDGRELPAEAVPLPG